MKQRNQPKTCYVLVILLLYILLLSNIFYKVVLLIGPTAGK